MTFWIIVHQLYFWIYKQNIWDMVTYSIIWKIVIVLLFLMGLYQLGYGASLVAQWKWSESLSVISDSLRPHGLHSPWNSPGQNTGVGSLSLLQEIFPTQGSNPGLSHCRWILYQSVWVSLIAQLVKNPLAMQETPVWFLGWGDPLEKG